MAAVRGKFTMVPGKYISVVCFLAVTGASAIAEAPRLIPDGREWEKEIATHCRAVRITGIFNRQTLARDPDLASAVEAKLCRSDLRVVGLEAGFGVGARVFGLSLQEADYALSWELYTAPDAVPADAAALLRRNQEAMERWKAEHCTAEQRGPYSGPIGPFDLFEATRWTRAHWAAEKAQVDPHLRNSWDSCMSDLAPPLDRSKRALRCRIVEIDQGVPGQRAVFFTLQLHRRADRASSLLRLPYRPVKLTRDLQEDGVVCDPPTWNKGMKLSGDRATLRCRRQGRGPIWFEAQTTKGACAVSLQTNR